MSLWAVGISAAVSVGTTAYAANANKKNTAAANNRSLSAQERFTQAALREAGLFSGEDAISFEELMGAGQNAARWNAGEGTGLANRSASAINANTLNDLEGGMSRLFGGGGAMERQRDAVNTNVEDMLAGRLSASARAQIGRSALNSGMRALSGPDGVTQAENAYLGIASEQQVDKGISAYGQLYSMYRNSYPMVTGAQTLSATTINPASAMQAAFQSSQQEFEMNRHASNLRMSAASGQLSALEAANARTTAAQEQSIAATAQMIGAVGQVAGAYFAPTQGVYNRTTQDMGNGITQTSMQYQPGQSMAGQQWGAIFSNRAQPPPTQAPGQYALGGGKSIASFGAASPDEWQGPVWGQPTY